MIRFFISFLFCFSILACDDDSSTSIEYVDLNDTTFAYLKPLTLDVDRDGAADFNFTTSLSAGSGESQINFLMTSIGAHRVAFDTLAEKIPVYSEGSEIGNVLPPHQQWDALANYLGEKHYYGSTDSVWFGDFVMTEKPFVAFSLYKNVEPYFGPVPYFGWIHLTFDTVQARVILHEYAYQTEPNISIKAGETK
ncbi:hypothetical protein HUU42_00965 [bacterium]|nr:hypothetical protein [bacterium]